MRFPGRAVLPPLLAAIASACQAPKAATVVRPDPPAPVTATDVDARLVKEGYRVVRRNEQILYCRSESVTGTLFASTVCLTASQIARQRRDLQESKDLLNQGHATQCVGPECIGK